MEFCSVCRQVDGWIETSLLFITGGRPALSPLRLLLRLRLLLLLLGLSCVVGVGFVVVAAPCWSC